eukprot:scaffold12409_cov22-Tisochrysis_lutea.AAC.1
MNGTHAPLCEGMQIKKIPHSRAMDSSSVFTSVKEKLHSSRPKQQFLDSHAGGSEDEPWLWSHGNESDLIVAALAFASTASPALTKVTSTAVSNSDTSKH